MEPPTCCSDEIWTFEELLKSFAAMKEGDEREQHATVNVTVCTNHTDTTITSRVSYAELQCIKGMNDKKHNPRSLADSLNKVKLI